MLERDVSFYRLKRFKNNCGGTLICRSVPIVALKLGLKRGSYRQNSPRSAVVLYTDLSIFGAHFRAYIKATQAGHELYLVPFLMMHERDPRRELRKPYPVIRSGS